MAFIDCSSEQRYVSKNKRPDRPHCDHGKWVSQGDRWKSPTYTTWENILVRTRYNGRYSQNEQRHAKYKGVELGWDTYEEFREALGPRPSLDHTIDRIDPEGGYTTENCQWLLAHLNYSKGGRNSARQASAAMIARMEAELQDLENELKEEGIKVE